MEEINYEELIGQWHKDRNLIDGSTDKDQYMKLIQEVGELSDSLCKGKDIRDDIGDIMVVLINIMVLAPIFVSAAQRRYFHLRRNLTRGRAGQAFLHLLTRQMSAKLLMKAFSCAAPRFIVTVVTRILVMCFPMGRSPPAFAIASIRRHWIL